MIWEMQVVVIVMVTRCVEIGKRKCAQYWPESDTGSAKHGHYNITVTSVYSSDGYDLRTLHLTFKVALECLYCIWCCVCLWKGEKSYLFDVNALSILHSILCSSIYRALREPLCISSSWPGLTMGFPPVVPAFGPSSLQSGKPSTNYPEVEVSL